MTVATPRAGESGPPEAAAVYALGSNEDESTRLQRQAEELRPEAAALLGQIGLKPGQSAIDLGCGRPRAGRGRGHRGRRAANRSAHRLVRPSARPHPAGDHPRARRGAGRDGPAGPPGRLGGRPGTRRRTRDLLPALPAWTRLHELFQTSFGRNGADLLIGRRLAELYREAGLRDVQVQARARAYPAGHTRRTVLADLVRSLRPMIVELGLADERELTEVDQAVRARRRRPMTSPGS